jgi:hypothetical protein
MTVEIIQAVGQYIVTPICILAGVAVFFWGLK